MFRKDGFTLIELLVVIAIIALLLSIIMPALRKVKAQAQEITCRAHLKSFGQAGLVYAHDNDHNLVDCHASGTGNGGGIGSYAVYITNFGGRWLGAGNFFKHNLIDVPKIFYCPANTNKTLKYGKDHLDPSSKGGGWPHGRVPEDLHPGQEWVQTTYHYRSLWDGQKWRQLNAAKDSGGTGFMVDMFADPDRGVDYHHKDSYNVVYLDGHSGPLVDKEREIVDFGGDVRYHADHVKQDKVWKRYFDIMGGRKYPEK